jgi:hypothetical protein
LPKQGLDPSLPIQGDFNATLMPSCFQFRFEELDKALLFLTKFLLFSLLWKQSWVTSSLPPLDLADHIVPSSNGDVSVNFLEDTPSMDLSCWPTLSSLTALDRCANTWHLAIAPWSSCLVTNLKKTGIAPLSLVFVCFSAQC